MTEPKTNVNADEQRKAEDRANGAKSGNTSSDNRGDNGKTQPHKENGEFKKD